MMRLKNIPSATGARFIQAEILPQFSDETYKTAFRMVVRRHTKILGRNYGWTVRSSNLYGVSQTDQKKYSSVNSIGIKHSGIVIPLFSQVKQNFLPLHSPILHLVRHVCNRTPTDILLEDIVVRIRNNNLSLENLPIWINKIWSSLYDQIILFLPSEELHNQRNQIFYNLCTEELTSFFCNNKEFLEMVDFIQCNVNRINITHCPLLLNLLTPLVGHGHHLIQTLTDLCKQNLHRFSLSEIVIFLGSNEMFIEDGMKASLELLQHVKSTVSMSDELFCDANFMEEFCKIIRNTGYFMSKERFTESALLMTNMLLNSKLLSHHPIDVLNMLCKFPFELGRDLDVRVKEKILELEIKLDQLDFSLMALSIDACLSMGTVLDPILQRSFLRRKRCEFLKTYFEEYDKNCDPLSILKLCFLFFTMNFVPNYQLRLHRQGSNGMISSSLLWHHVAQAIAVCDKYWLVQMLKLCIVGRLPLEMTSKIYQRIENELHHCTTEQLNWLRNSNNGEMALLLLNSFIKQPPRCDLKEFPKAWELINGIMAENLDNCEMRTFIEIQLLINNHLKGSKEVDHPIEMVHQLDTQALLFFSTLLQSAMNETFLISKVKKRIYRLRNTMKRELQDRMSSVSFLPPTTLLPKNQIYINSIHPSKNSLLLSSSEVNNLIKSLAFVTSTLEEDRCLRTLNILDEVSNHSPSFLPETFENLLKFVYSCESIPLHSFLSLVKIISLAGYQPEDFGRFRTFCVQFQLAATAKKLLKPLEQMKLTYYLSLMEVFDNINLCLSVDNLLTLDKEINNLYILNPRLVSFYQTCLFKILQCLTIECPHLCVQQFMKNPVSIKQPPMSVRLQESLKRIFNDSSLVSTATHSSYGHSIDALVRFDWDGFSYLLKDPHCPDNSFSGDITSYRFALLHLGPNHFCMGSVDKLRGLSLASIRQLQLLGYTVIQVPYTRLQMMDLQHDDSLDCFIKSTIQSELGIDDLFD